MPSQEKEKAEKIVNNSPTDKGGAEPKYNAQQIREDVFFYTTCATIVLSSFAMLRLTRETSRSMAKLWQSRHDNTHPTTTSNTQLFKHSNSNLSLTNHNAINAPNPKELAQNASHHRKYVQQQSFVLHALKQQTHTSNAPRINGLLANRPLYQQVPHHLNLHRGRNLPTTAISAKAAIAVLKRVPKP